MPNFANAYQTTLSGSLTNVATSCTVSGATGIPNAPFSAHLVAEGANTDEIVLVTNISGTTLTIVRASQPYNGVQSASAHASGAGFRAVLTAADVQPLSAIGLIYAYNTLR